MAAINLSVNGNAVSVDAPRRRFGNANGEHRGRRRWRIERCSKIRGSIRKTAAACLPGGARLRAWKSLAGPIPGDIHPGREFAWLRLDCARGTANTTLARA